MENTTIELRNEFTGIGEVKGFEFRQISKSEQAYIYEVKSDGKLYYEIFKRLKTAVCLNFEFGLYSDGPLKKIGRLLKMAISKNYLCATTLKSKYDEVELRTQYKEIYPKSNQFGVTAWTSGNLEDAAKRFNELSNP